MPRGALVLLHSRQAASMFDMGTELARWRSLQGTNARARVQVLTGVKEARYRTLVSKRFYERGVLDNVDGDGDDVARARGIDLLGEVRPPPPLIL